MEQRPKTLSRNSLVNGPARISEKEKKTIPQSKHSGNDKAFGIFAVNCKLSGAPGKFGD
jgi:hypothetical protein